MGQGKDGPIITENGNMILDVWMDYIPEIQNPPQVDYRRTREWTLYEL